MMIDNCVTCDKHGYRGNGFVICRYYGMAEQRITRTGMNNVEHIISCPLEDDPRADRKNDYPPRWGKNPAPKGR